MHREEQLACRRPHHRRPVRAPRGASGTSNGGQAAASSCSPDLASAISHTVELASERDVVIIAGRGHERTQTVDGRMLVLDDARSPGATWVHRIHVQAHRARGSVGVLPVRADASKAGRVVATVASLRWLVKAEAECEWSCLVGGSGLCLDVGDWEAEPLDLAWQVELEPARDASGER